MQKKHDLTTKGSLVSAGPFFSSFEPVANALASQGLLGNIGFLSLVLSVIVLPLYSSLENGEDNTGSQTMSASFTTNFTNSEKGGKTLFSSFQLNASQLQRLLSHFGSFETSFRFSWSSFRT